MGSNGVGLEKDGPASPVSGSLFCTAHSVCCLPKDHPISQLRLRVSCSREHCWEAEATKQNLHPSPSTAEPRLPLLRYHPKPICAVSRGLFLGVRL